MTERNLPPSQTSQPPDSQAPGPRASRLLQVFDQALARTLRANSYSNFASCFPTPARHVPASLESVWRQLNAKLEESAKSEFEEIIEERNAVAHLNDLDRLVNEAKARRGAEGDAPPGDAPHTLGAEELYQAHLTPYLQEAQSSLNDKIETTNAQNSALAQTVQAQRQEIEKLLSHLESVVTDIEGGCECGHPI
ncbi:MIND kinetochore complex component Nnf1 [Penicillium chermesinum]|uniref:MIND kinetochore complex component Nnf1 n=1 Tax=Penicillium chermesinum TaxID=63820 RepID=A0A9W9TS61_9EURO|nr:MIND kinetochore complex component Nnf1 [Penicillium chermesinum]KAJ5238718.1 MIND kinetochore complex component Nnf1 [Penicillium chermesinum]